MCQHPGGLEGKPHPDPFSLTDGEQRRANGSLFDNSQQNQCFLNPGAVVAHGWGKNGIAQRLQHAGQAEGFSVVVRQPGPVHFHLRSGCQAAETKQGAFSSQDVRLQEKIVIPIQQGDFMGCFFQEGAGLHEAQCIE